MRYDYIIVGSGLYGATFANLAHAAGKSVLVIDRRSHIGGNVYTERIESINVHKYGLEHMAAKLKDIYINLLADR